MTGVIDKNRFGNYVIHVLGYPRVQYIGYSKREAIQKYRLDYGITGRHINFCDMCDRSYYLENGEYVKC